MRFWVEKGSDAIIRSDYCLIACVNASKCRAVVQVLKGHEAAMRALAGDNRRLPTQEKRVEYVPPPAQPADEAEAEIDSLPSVPSKGQILSARPESTSQVQALLRTFTTVPQELKGF